MEEIPDRPEVLELTFPDHESLVFWKDNGGRHIMSPSLWLYDGTCYRYPFSQFRLYFVETGEGAKVGRWCIYTEVLSSSDGGCFCQESDTSWSASPADSIPFNTWRMRFGEEVELLGTVSCNVIPRSRICEGIETYITAKASRIFRELSNRGLHWGFIIWEDLSNLQGHMLLPWVKDCIGKFFQWTGDAYAMGRYHQAECATNIIYWVLKRDLLAGPTEFPDGDPLSPDSPDAAQFVKEILKLPAGKKRLNGIGCGSLMLLMTKRDPKGWESLILLSQEKPLQLFSNFVRAHINGASGSVTELFSSLYDGLCQAALDRSFEDDPEALGMLHNICFMVAEAIHEKKDKGAHTILLSETLATMASTRDVYREEECTLVDPIWWKKLDAEVQESLNHNAPDRFLCPITHEIMRNPSLLSCSGHTYDRYAISWWMKKPNSVDPRSNLPIPDGANLFPNTDLRLEICDWCKEEAKKMAT